MPARKSTAPKPEKNKSLECWICDPTCGSGGLLIKCEIAMEERMSDCGDKSPLSRRDMSRAKTTEVLPKSYHILKSRTLASLFKTMASISADKGGDTFGLIYD